MLGVEGNCYAYVAPVPNHQIQTNFMGSVQMASRFGNGVLKVGIAASNVYGRITYISSDSYRSTCSWHGYM